MAVVVTTNLLLAAVARSPNSFRCSLPERRCPITTVRIAFLRPTLGQACRRICCDSTFGPWSIVDYWTAWRDIQNCWSKKKCRQKIILRWPGVEWYNNNNNNSNNVYSIPQKVYSAVLYINVVHFNKCQINAKSFGKSRAIIIRFEWTK